MTVDLLKNKMTDDGSLAGVHFSYEEKEELSAWWETLTTPIYEVWTDYPQADGSYEQEPSSTICRQCPDEDIWLLSDDAEGMGAATGKDVAGWSLKEKR